ncbi:hypothetical protein Vafri_5844 [Volvox africanus]|nr:hypothetical protein Vafri_5844 [Volvox africanus]
MSPTPIVQHLQQQAAGLARALVLLASEAEADAARLALHEAQGREREAQLAGALQENRRLAVLAEASEQVQLVTGQLQKEREENAALQSRMRSMRKKLKAAFEDMAAQNKDLREKLTQAKEDQNTTRAETGEEVRRLKEKLAESSEQLRLQRQGEEELQAEVRKARQLASASAERAERLVADLDAARLRAQRMQGLEEDLEDVEARAVGVARRVVVGFSQHSSH